jgi:3-dehydrotetronate 4-kinase
MLLGCIADDFTGATDLANTLSRKGMQTVQTIGIPAAPPDDADAVVVALKSRTIPAADAVAQSLEACRWLRKHGAQQIYFKYCSTFDSTDKGNIGPVADALLEELSESITVICPAFPENNRTIYLGHLFVGDALLSESSMRNHPLTPMTDSNLVAVMSRQSKHRVGNIPVATIRQGASAIHAALSSLSSEGVRYAVCDVLENADLMEIGTAATDMKLVTGGSGAALGLPENFRRSGLLVREPGAQKLLPVGGQAVVLAGSCSAATLQQIGVFKNHHKIRAIEIESLFTDAAAEIERAVMWASEQGRPCLLHASASPADVRRIQQHHGRDVSGETIERAMGTIAQKLAERGVRRFIVAGGETSGAVARALNIQALDIGAQIAPGVPATQSRGSKRFALVLKSGNFGGPDFFREAVEAIP